MCLTDRMAKRASTRTRTIVKTVKAPTPIIRVSAPRASSPPTKRRKGGRRRSSSSGGGGKLNGVLSHVAGGFGYGLVEKTFPNLPTIPILGRTGTITAIAYFLQGKVPFAKEVMIAGAVLSGYQLGKDGAIHGDDMDDFAQVRGVSAQV